MNNIHPIIIRDYSLPSNVFFAPINPGYSTNGVFSDEYNDFFTKRSGKKIGICYVGNVSLQNEWSSNNKTAVLSLNSPSRWAELSSKIRANGSLPGIQLAWKPQELNMQRAFVSNNITEQINLFRNFYDHFDEFECAASQFIENITNSANLGFSVIQLHAAHGYALSLLLSKEVSRCSDPAETKGYKLIREIINGLSKRNFILDVRLSLYEGIGDKGDELLYKMQLFHSLSDSGLDMISLSNGFYNINKTMIYPSKKEGPIILNDAKNIANCFPDIIWNVAGNMETILSTNIDLPQNLTFSLGRQLISDPDTITKIEKRASINRCSECNDCHYYSYGLEGIQPCKI